MIALPQMYQMNITGMIALIDYRMIPLPQMYQMNITGMIALKRLHR